MTRKIFRISGTDTHDFLQGLVTNDMARIKDGILYAAMLTPQGKLIADFFLVDAGAFAGADDAGDDAVLLDVAAGFAPALIQRLTMYKLRADVAISESGLQVARGTGPTPEGALADPRHPALGWRAYGEDGGEDGSDWDAIRVANCIPETGQELTSDSYILETGFERLNGVDFRKGCYVGQEVTARMKHKTELRKGLAKVRIIGDATPGDEITLDGKPVGTLHTRAGDTAIAYLRFDRSGGEMQAGAATLVRIPGD